MPEQVASNCILLDGVLALATDQHAVFCIVRQKIARVQGGRRHDAESTDAEHALDALIKRVGGQGFMMPVGPCSSTLACACC
jgi:hypothetical protein